jgi:hypothetical protein
MGMARKNICVHTLYDSPNRYALDEAIVNEKDENGLLAAEVGIGDVALTAEYQSTVAPLCCSVGNITYSTGEAK